MTVERWYKEKRPKLLESVQLEKPEQLIKLDRLAPIGNLAEEERQILQQACTEKTN